MEFHALDVGWFEEIIDAPQPVIHDGHLHFTGKPGLGIELDEDVAHRHLMPGQTWFD